MEITREQVQVLSEQADAAMRVCGMIAEVEDLWNLFFSTYLDFTTGEQAAVAAGLQNAQRAGVAAILTRAGHDVVKEAERLFMDLSDLSNTLRDAQESTGEATE